MIEVPIREREKEAEGENEFAHFVLERTKGSPKGRTMLFATSKIIVLPRQQFCAPTQLREARKRWSGFKRTCDIFIYLFFFPESIVCHTTAPTSRDVVSAHLPRLFESFSRYVVTSPRTYRKQQGFFFHETRAILREKGRREKGLMPSCV